MPMNDHSSASSVADTVERPQLTKYVAFFIGDSLRCVPAADIAEVVPPLSPAPVPNIGSPVLGIASVRGEIVTMVDIRSLLQVEGTEPLTQRSRTVVLKQSPGQAQPAFTVDRMWELVQLSDIELTKTGHGISAAIAETTSGPIELLDAAAIANEIEKSVLRN